MCSLLLLLLLNPPNSAHLGGIPYHVPKLHPGPCNSVGMRPRTYRHRNRQKDTHTHTHTDAFPQYISRRLRLTRNVTIQCANVQNLVAIRRIVCVLRIAIMVIFMAALRSRCGYCIFVSFLSSFFPRLISAVANWVSTILLHMVWP